MSAKAKKGIDRRVGCGGGERSGQNKPQQLLQLDPRRGSSRERVGTESTAGWRVFVGQLPFYLENDRLIRKH